MIDRPSILFYSKEKLSMRTTMVYLFAAGKRLKLEMWSGTMLRQIREFGIPAPYNLTVCSVLERYIN